MRVVVTGANGQLGRTLRYLSPWTEVAYLSHADLDVTSRVALSRFFEQFRPQWVVNCAAYTAVDRAESEVDAAYRVNALAPRLLAECAAEVGAHLLHISTDYVFCGEGNLPHTEQAVPAPEGVYARSKTCGGNCSTRCGKCARAPYQLVILLLRPQFLSHDPDKVFAADLITSGL